MPDTNDTLPPEAQAALNAYQSMSESKKAYFSLLSEIDQKYREGGSPTIAENLQLEKLLGAHNEAVAAFNEAMQAVTELEVRELLLTRLMGEAGKH